MARRKLSYELSRAADTDLDAIYDYTADKFGIPQAVKYLTGLEDIFETLCSSPESWRAREEIRKNLRSISYASHTIFYRVLTDRIRIVRVLHGSRDIIRLLPPKD